MAAKEEDKLDTLLSRICKDLLEKSSLKRSCFEEFLTKVLIPAGWEDEYKLCQTNPTYKFRYDWLEKYIKQKEAEGFWLPSGTSKQFSQGLQQLFQEYDGFPESSNHPGNPSFDIFEENVKVQGVVVLKSEKYKKASVLVKRNRRGRGGGCVQYDELILDLKEDADSMVGSCIKVGDIVDVTKSRRRGETALEPEIIKCFSLCESEIVSFLKHLLNCIDTDGSTAALTEVARCHAAWHFTLDLPVDKCSDQTILDVLNITDKIFSGVQMQMSQTLWGIMEPFEKSLFFTSVLPNFVNKIIKEEGSSENCSLVQTFLEHILSASPSCGPRVLPMATNLAKSMVSSSQDYESAKENGQRAVDFLAKLLSIIALKVPGACEDVDALQWRELPLIPVAQEIRHVKYKKVDLPVIKKSGKYDSEEEYLNTYFRLLREECFHKLKKGITDFVRDPANFDPRDMMLYRISLRGISTHDERLPIVLSIALKYRIESKEKTDLDQDSTHWLKYGNLLCVSFDDNFQEPVWALVEKHIGDQSIVWVTLCKEKTNVITEAQFITKLQEMTDRGEEVYMAESQSFYVSFGPAMDVLQQKDCVPFKEFLVEACQSMEPASYMEKIKKPPDWGVVFEKSTLPSSGTSHVKGQAYSLLKDFDALKLNGQAESRLDNTQLDAVELTLKNKLTLIQGPPGTGKSFVGVTLVNLLMSMDVPRKYGPILVVTYKNFALDHFLNDCIDKLSSPSVKIVRVGRVAEDAPDKLKQCLIHQVGRSWSQHLFNQKRKLTGKLWGMQPRVLQAYTKLKGTSIFNTDMFLKEATEEHVRWLLIGNGVERANVENLLQEKEDRSNRRRLEEDVQKALTKWLPSQQELDSFAGKKEKSGEKRRKSHLSPAAKGAKSHETSPAGTEKQKGKKEAEPEDDPSDFREPSSEQRERLLAVDEEQSDEDDVEEHGDGHKLDSSSSVLSDLKPWERKLVALDDKNVSLSRDLLNAHDVWDLKSTEKIQLVYVLRGEFHKRASEEFQTVTTEYVKIHQQLQELKNQHNIQVMRKCHVIGMTVTGATMRANLLADIKPSVMIVEEAAEILEGQLVAVIPPSVQHLIMIGDHKQLRPMVHFDRLRRHHNLDLSMFERLVNCKLPCKQLGKQCRMMDVIAELLRKLKIYDKLETNFELVKHYEPPACVTTPMYFWTHTEHETQSKDSHSKRNTREAREITTVAERFCQEGRVPASKITVLCSYRGQVDEIKNRLKSSKVEAVKDIAVTTIDSFQGQENDIILISLVRSNKEGVIGYLKEKNRLCVAISRAHCGLYLFGNHTHLANRSSTGWRVLSDTMRKEKCLGSRFPFRSDEDSRPRSYPGSLSSENSSSKEQATARNYTVNINAQQANVSVGENVTVNRKSDDSQPGGMSPQTIRLPPAPSGKTPVQDPQTPISASPGSPFEKQRRSVDDSKEDAEVAAGEQESVSGRKHSVEAEILLGKQAKKPTQETKGGEKTVEGSIKPEDISKEEPVQETEDLISWVIETPMAEAGQGPTEFSEREFEEFSKEKPVQETEESTSKEQPVQETEESQGKERPVQETEESPGKERPVQETEESPGKERPLQETEESPGKERPVQETEESPEKERPVQETEESPGKERPVQETEESPGKVRPLQETEESPGKERPVQETEESPGKEKPVQETEESPGKERPLQETEESPGKERPVQETEESPGKERPLQETEESPGKERPMQETEESPGKERPLQETEESPGKERPVQETEESPGKERPVQETEESPGKERPVQETEESPGKERPVQETEESPGKERPVQETEESPGKERPVQETEESPGKERSVQETEESPGKERPVQETEESPGKERSVQETEESPGKERPLQETEESPGKERPMQETEESPGKEKPLQETEESPGKERPVQETEEKPLQETENPVKEKTGDEQEIKDFTGGKRDLQEREGEELFKAKPVQKTDEKPKTVENEPTKKALNEGSSMQLEQDTESGQPFDELTFDELAKDKPLQETATPDTEKAERREEKLVGQEEKTSRQREFGRVREEKQPIQSTGSSEQKKAVKELLQERLAKNLEQFRKAPTPPTSPTKRH